MNTKTYYQMQLNPAIGIEDALTSAVKEFYSKTKCKPKKICVSLDEFRQLENALGSQIMYRNIIKPLTEDISRVDQIIVLDSLELNNVEVYPNFGLSEGSIFLYLKD